jgi:hypothetical protein
MNDDTTFVKILDEAYATAVKRAVDQAFLGRWGFDDGAKITSVIRDAAIDLVRTDLEIKAKIKRRMIELIDKGYSDK